MRLSSAGGALTAYTEILKFPGGNAAVESSSVLPIYDIFEILKYDQ